MRLKRGYIQVYTGNGKGKTTAAIGLAVRAAGAGLKVYFAQFMKKREYSEIKAMRDRFKGHVTLKQFGSGCFVYKKSRKQDPAVYKRGLKEIRKAVSSGLYDVVILDELNVALYYDLIPLNEVLSIFIERPAHVEIVTTGRKAPKEIVDMADLVTSMDDIRHYYNDGVKARKGIEC